MDNLSLIYENSLHNKIRRDVLQEFIYQKTNNKHQKAEYMVEHVLNSSELEYLTEQRFLIKATLNSLSTNIIRSNSENINNIEIRNFAKPSNARAVIDDSRMDGFIGEGIFDDSDKITGYAYGYRMGADGEYGDIEYIDTNDITFFSDKFKQSVVENGIENVCPPEITFYVANLAVDKPYRSYVEPLLNALLNRISSEGYKYIAFDGLRDTIRLFDSARKASRLSDRNLIKLAESDQGESKFVLFYIK